MTKNLIIIPARKGSKRIKNKNIVSVLNRPLILWTIDYAKKLSKKKFWVRFFLSKKVNMMFLHVLEVFLGCFSRSACHERRRRERG